MIYLIGGSPRSGKSILGQRVAAKLNIGWISTDLLAEILRVKQVAGAPTQWDASPEAIRRTAEWFFPCLERFVWGVSSMSDGYLIEGVDFLPEHIAQLSSEYPIRSVFLGCESMTLERFDAFPGRSRGYANLPLELRQQFAQDVPSWSKFIKQECQRFACSYIDTSHDFAARLSEAEDLLLSS